MATLITCTMHTELDSENGAAYLITAETSLKGSSRLNIECFNPETDETVNSQGVDLTRKECLALANILIANAQAMEEI